MRLQIIWEHLKQYKSLKYFDRKGDQADCKIDDCYSVIDIKATTSIIYKLGKKH